MKKIGISLLISFLIAVLIISGNAQTSDSVDVTFFYKPDGNPSIVYLPGEFNNWANNNGGVITDPQFAMILDPSTGIWSKKERLRVGGPDPLPSPNSIPGAYQYKFNEGGTASGWLPDPLNPRQNPNDNNNSYLFIRNPTIHYLLPNSTPAIGVVRTRFPEITAYIFPGLGSSVDTSSIVIKIDSLVYTTIGNRYDSSNHKLSFATPDPLGDGTHQLILLVQSSLGTQGSDTTTFAVQADIIQLLSLSAETWKSNWRIQGAIFKPNGGFDSTVTVAQIIRPDTSWTVSVANGRVDTVLSLIEGDNLFQLQADVGGQLQTSDTLIITQKVNHSPTAQIDISQNGNMIDLIGSNSFDPDSQALTYLWKEDPANPEVLGINGQTSPDLALTKPASAGEYYVSLLVEDLDANVDSMRTYFVVVQDSPNIEPAGYADNPFWVKDGRIYLLFFKAFTPQGTFQAAIPHLDYIKAMGFDIIWVLPVMDVPGNIDNQVNIGYNILDFFNVDPTYGTNQDFKDFMDAAHSLGLKVILDVTPNHTSSQHPFAAEAKLYQGLSQYWYYYQTQFIPHNDNGLGQCVTPEGIYYYCGFSSALLNYNWSDMDARTYMSDVYEYWVHEFGIDGFRFDVYWGPHRRYGEANMGIPVRETLKHIKPDLLLLGEDSGTGVGTEVIYADHSGGLDAGYDFKLYWNGINSFSFNSSAVNTLHNELDNSGYYPGENSYFMRFMESQDEDRISYIHDSFVKTMPLATTIFTAPGMPMMYNGQEVGFGKDMGNPGEPDLNDRRRGIIDWEFGGKALLQPHYQRIAQIRAQFPAFRQHKKDTNGDGQLNNQDEPDFKRVTTGNGIVYSFLRPYTDENGLTVVNFSNSAQSVTLDLTTVGLKFTGGFNTGHTYWVNSLYADTSYQVLGSDLANFAVSLPGYGSAVFTISTEEAHVVLPPLNPPSAVNEDDRFAISGYRLNQNYPNPFNPETIIKYSIAKSEWVKIIIYNNLGQRVKTLIDKRLDIGYHEAKWDATNDVGNKVGSGIYFYVMRSGNYRNIKKMILLK